MKEIIRIINKKINNIFHIKKCEIKRSIQEKEISQKQMMDLLKNKEIILLDVRSEQEYKEGHLNGAINIPDFNIYQCVKNKIPDKTKDIIVYCQSGIRSKKVQNILEKLGYHNVYNLNGGLNELTEK